MKWLQRVGNYWFKIQILTSLEEKLLPWRKKLLNLDSLQRAAAFPNCRSTLRFSYIYWDYYWFCKLHMFDSKLGKDDKQWLEVCGEEFFIFCGDGCRNVMFVVRQEKQNTKTAVKEPTLVMLILRLIEGAFAYGNGLRRSLVKPIVTLIDTPSTGDFLARSWWKRAKEAMPETLKEMFMPKCTGDLYYIGEGASGGALVCNRRSSHSCWKTLYSVISPESCLYSLRSWIIKGKQRTLKLTATDMKG